MHHYLLKNAPALCPGGQRTEGLYIRNGMIAPLQTCPASVLEIDCSGYVLLPGLINAHDHLELNHFPRTRFRDRYDNAHQWGEDVSRRLDTEPYVNLRRKRLRDRCLIGGIKNLLSGVTTVAHHNPLHRALRRRQFPVHVLQRYVWAHSLHFEDEDTIRHAIASIPPDIPFIIHLAEGTDRIAADEYKQLAHLGAARSNTILVHGVGLRSAERDHAVTTIGGLIWCPSTNFYLLGATTDVVSWAAAEKLAIGSDSRLTADGDLLDETRVAYATGQLGVEDLFKAITLWPAKILGFTDRGTLQPGCRADVIALPLNTDDKHPLEALTVAKRADVGMVLRGGVPMVGKSGLLQQFQGEKFTTISVDGHPRRVQYRLAKQLRRSSLQEPGVIIED
jgi:cytosine/adenosine deaminase-related metal-dependent hydrolase